MTDVPMTDVPMGGTNSDSSAPFCHYDEGARLAALRRYQILDTPAEPAFDDLVRLIARICDTPIAVINLIDENRQWFKSELGLGVRETAKDVSICVHALMQQDIFIVPDTLLDPRFANNPLVTGKPHLRFYAGALLETSDGFPLGTLCVLDYQPRQLNPLQLEALQTLARQTMRLIELYHVNRLQADMLHELEEAREKMAVLASTDALTGLMNRRAFSERLKQEHALLQRRSGRASLLMVDLDNFKALNDTHGHQTGDDALKIFARICTEVFRSADVVARWGGEEFIALLPDTDLHQAVSVAERLRTQFAQVPIPAEEGDVYLTLSVGALVMDGSEAIRPMMRRLDDLLYAAKEQGRNRVVAE